MPRRRPLVFALGAFSAAGLIAAGCGGGSSSSTTTALTKGQFVAKANAICAQTQKRAASFKKDYPRPGSTPAQDQRFLKEIAPLAHETAAKIAALSAPNGAEAQVAAIKKAIAREATAFAKGATAPAKARAIIKDSALYAQTDKATKAYGLTKC